MRQLLSWLHLQALLHNGDRERQQLVPKHGGQDVQAGRAALAQVPPVDLLPIALAPRVAVRGRPVPRPPQALVSSTLTAAGTRSLAVQQFFCGQPPGDCSST